jgi:transposase
MFEFPCEYWVPPCAGREAPIRDYIQQPVSMIAANQRVHLGYVHQAVEQATEHLLVTEADPRALALLLSIPGIGELTARTLLAEIETIRRFADPEKLISYAGLAPRVRQSSGMDRRGALTKRGSVWLRTALVESAQIAVRRPNQFQKIFRRVSFRRRRNVGIVAAARRLAEGDLACVVQGCVVPGTCESRKRIRHG